ncbi:MAG: C40 family peptidase [Nocardiaceae bacterium]|nr:C40 family peptidase [Nocardiaceae bacterium]
MASKSIKRAVSTALIAGLFTAAATAPATAQKPPAHASSVLPATWYTENNTKAAAVAPFIPAPPPVVVPEPVQEIVAPIIAAVSSVVDFATGKAGSPYVYGANGPSAFDCSGLVQWSYAQAGKSIPRTSSEQWAAGTPVSLDAIQPGDIVVMYGGGHVGIYIGNGQIVHALNEGTGVIIDAMSNYGVDGVVRF